jgi:hypothetical protein
MSDAATRRLLDYRMLMGFALPSAPKDVDALRRYYIGDQVIASDVPDTVSATIRDLLSTATGDGFSVNVCARIVDALVAALNVTGVQADGNAPEVEATVWDWWRTNSLTRQTDVLFTAAATEQEAYLLLDFDAEGDVKVGVNRRLDNGDGTGLQRGIEPVDIDAEGNIVSAFKFYNETHLRDDQPGAVRRIVDAVLAGLGLADAREAVKTETWTWRYVYEPGRIRRYVKRPAQPREELVSDEVWPYDLPIVRFTSPKGGELRPTILALQDLVNDAALALANLMRIRGFPIPYFVNLEPISTELDDSDDAKDDVYQVKTEVGTALQLDSVDGKQPMIGTLEASNPTDLLAVLQAYSELAFLLGETPIHLLPWHGTQPPSGEALKTANQPFEGKLQRYQDHFTEPFERLFRLGQQMSGVADPPRVTPQWAEIEYGSGLTTAQEAQLWQQLNVPLDLIWAKLLGFTPDEIAQAEEYRVAAETRRAEIAARLALTTEQAGIAAQPDLSSNGQSPPQEVTPNG